MSGSPSDRSVPRWLVSSESVESHQVGFLGGEVRAGAFLACRQSGERARLPCGFSLEEPVFVVEIADGSRKRWRRTASKAKSPLLVHQPSIERAAWQKTARCEKPGLEAVCDGWAQVVPKIRLRPGASSLFPLSHSLLLAYIWFSAGITIRSSEGATARVSQYWQFLANLAASGTLARSSV